MPSPLKRLRRPQMTRSTVLRIAAVAAVLTVYAAIKVVTASSYDDALEIVPGDSYVYVHARLDEGADQYEKAAELAERFPNFPLLVQTVLGRLSGAAGGNLEFERDVSPWLGDEAALALMPAEGIVAESVLLIEASDDDRAIEFLDRVAGRPKRSDYKGTQLRAYGDDFVAANVEGFIALGQEQALKRTIDTADGRARSLADDSAAEAARERLPEDRIADAYASRDGVRRLLAQQDGVLGQIGAAIDHPALRGAAAAAVAHDSGVEVVSVSELEAERNKRRTGFGAFQSFQPTLAGELAEDTFAYVGVANLERTLSRLIGQARATAPGIAAGFDKFARDVNRSSKVDLRKQLLPLLKGEASLSVTPGSPAPVMTVIVKGVDEKKAKQALARLQRPVAQAVKPGRSGRAATFKQRKVAGVDAFTVGVSPTIDLTYSVFDDKLVISSNPKGVEMVRADGSSLRESKAYEKSMQTASGEVSSLLFLNLDQMIGLAERAGLAEDPAYAAVREDARRLKALGVRVTGAEDHTKARLFLVIQ